MHCTLRLANGARAHRSFARAHTRPASQRPCGLLADVERIGAMPKRIAPYGLLRLACAGVLEHTQRLFTMARSERRCQSCRIYRPCKLYRTSINLHPAVRCLKETTHHCPRQSYAEWSRTMLCSPRWTARDQRRYHSRMCLHSRSSRKECRCCCALGRRLETGRQFPQRTYARSIQTRLILR